MRLIIIRAEDTIWVGQSNDDSVTIKLQIVEGNVVAEGIQGKACTGKFEAGGYTARCCHIIKDKRCHFINNAGRKVNRDPNSIARISRLNITIYIRIHFFYLIPRW